MLGLLSLNCLRGRKVRTVNPMLKKPPQVRILFQAQLFREYGDDGGITTVCKTVTFKETQ